MLTFVSKNNPLRFSFLTILLTIQDAISRKTEVMNLLESAGFSRSNPYYVVQQGKVCMPPMTTSDNLISMFPVYVVIHIFMFHR